MRGNFCVWVSCPELTFLLPQTEKFPADIAPQATRTTLDITVLIHPKSVIRKGRLMTKLVSILFITRVISATVHRYLVERLMGKVSWFIDARIEPQMFQGTVNPLVTVYTYLNSSYRKSDCNIGTCTIESHPGHTSCCCLQWYICYRLLYFCWWCYCHCHLHIYCQYHHCHHSHFGRN
jgi:hypothetical protein